MESIGEYMHGIWTHLLDEYPRVLVLGGGTVMAHTGVWLLFNIPYTILMLLKIPFFEKYRIQPEREISNKDVLRAFIMVLLQQFFVIYPIVYVTQGVVTFKWSRTLPSVLTVAGYVVLYQFFEDFVEYWGHRLFHTPFFYKHIHKQHHFYKSPFSLTAEHAHPIEFLFCNYMPLMSGPVLFPHHPVTFWVWVAWRVILASEIHSGYNFPWNLERYFSIYAGPIHHDRHHESFNGNYASSLKWLDWVFGTHITTPRKVRLSKNKKGGDSVSKEAPAESLLKEE